MPATGAGDAHDAVEQTVDDGFQVADLVVAHLLEIDAFGHVLSFLPRSAASHVLEKAGPRGAVGLRRAPRGPAAHQP